MLQSSVGSHRFRRSIGQQQLLGPLERSDGKGISEQGEVIAEGQFGPLR